jgi:hypothetical protein
METEKTENKENNIFADLSKLVVRQDYARNGVKKMLVNVPVRSPDKEWFVRTHPSEEYHRRFGCIKLKDDKDKIYLVLPDLHDALEDEATFKIYDIQTAITKQGQIFLWPLRQPSGDRQDNWAETAMVAAEAARSSWVKLKSNMHAGCYDVSQAVGNWPDPDWPIKSFPELIEIGFKGRVINNENHLVLKILRCEE